MQKAVLESKNISLESPFFSQSQELEIEGRLEIEKDVKNNAVYVWFRAKESGYFTLIMTFYAQEGFHVISHKKTARDLLRSLTRRYSHESERAIENIPSLFVKTRQPKDPFAKIPITLEDPFRMLTE